MVAWLMLIIVAIGVVAVLARTPANRAPPEPAPSADTTPQAGDSLTNPASTSP